MTDFELTGESIGDTGGKKAKAKAKAKKPAPKDKNHAFYSFMVSTFCSDPKKITFIFQYKRAKELFAIIPDKKFWKWLNAEGHKIYSLKEWLKPEKTEWLKFQNKKRNLNLSDKKTYSLENKPIGKNKKGLKYHKNLIDFTDDE
jgi:hypothetical protein